MTWIGGCLCGDIRYEAEVTDTENWYCHCRMCQKASGSVVATSAIVPQGHYGVESWISWLKIEDKLKREPTQENEYG